MWSKVAALFYEIGIGLIYDTIGRRWTIFVGFLVFSVCIGCIPLSHTVYPDFLIMRIGIELAFTILLNSPLLPDYIE